MIDKRIKPTKLLWVDLEMTGLNPASDAILEVAAIITDFNVQELARYEAVIHQPDEVLARANAWASDQHASSGLTERVRTQGKTASLVQQELTQFIHSHFGQEPAILAGNSIHQDRNFIRTWWPEVEMLLHYRMLDVSSLKVFMQGKFGVEFKKQDVHRALEDIQASMAEWQYYIVWLSQQQAGV